MMVRNPIPEVNRNRGFAAEQFLAADATLRTREIYLKLSLRAIRHSTNKIPKKLADLARNFAQVLQTKPRRMDCLKQPARAQRVEFDSLSRFVTARLYQIIQLMKTAPRSFTVFFGVFLALLCTAGQIRA